MFKWFNIREFLSTPEEWHAFVNGLCFALCPFFLLAREIRKELSDAIVGELHYFAFGGFLGVWAWIGIAKAVF